MLTAQDVLINGSVDASTFEIINSKLYLNVGALIGQGVNSLTNPCIDDLYLKLHLALWRSQTAYNASKPAGQRINSWFEPSSGSAQYYSNLTPAGFYAAWSCQSNFLVPSNVDSVVAVLQ
ncbi:MAG TPA: hypothetical protein V6D28_27830 [Leptolyngbyaceae cyanobacterium]